MTTMSQPAPANIASWVRDRAASDPELPAIKQGDTVLTLRRTGSGRVPIRNDAERSRCHRRRSGGHDHAERGLLPDRLLRDPAASEPSPYR